MHSLFLILAFTTTFSFSNFDIQKRLYDFLNTESLNVVSSENHPHFILEELAKDEDLYCKNLSKLPKKYLLLISPYHEEYSDFYCSTAIAKKIRDEMLLGEISFNIENSIFLIDQKFNLNTSNLKSIHPVGHEYPPFFSGLNFVDTKAGEVIYQRDLIDGGYSNMALEEGEIVLTFDDGPHPSRTQEAMAILEKFEVKAVFFQVGEKAMAYPQISSLVSQKGHVLASHSTSHKNLPKIPLKQATNEIIGGHNMVFYAAQTEDSGFFRFPYGARNLELAKVLKQNQISSFFWNMDSRDWALRDPVELYNHVVDEINRERKGVLLFHDIHSQTIFILEDLLANLQKAGYKIRLAYPKIWKEEL